MINPPYLESKACSAIKPERTAVQQRKAIKIKYAKFIMIEIICCFLSYVGLFGFIILLRFWVMHRYWEILLFVDLLLKYFGFQPF